MAGPNKNQTRTKRRKAAQAGEPICDYCGDPAIGWDEDDNPICEDCAKEQADEEERKQLNYEYESR